MSIAMQKNPEKHTIARVGINKTSKPKRMAHVLWILAYSTVYEPK